MRFQSERAASSSTNPSPSGSGHEVVEVCMLQVHHDVLSWIYTQCIYRSQDHLSGKFIIRISLTDAGVKVKFFWLSVEEFIRRMCDVIVIRI